MRQRAYKVDVVDVRDLNLKDETWDYLSDHYEIYNDSYYRYYPGHSSIKKEVKEEVDKALQEAGIVFPEVMYRPVGDPSGYYSFYVLLRFDW